MKMGAFVKIQSSCFRGVIAIAVVLFVIVAETWSLAESDPISKGSKVYLSKKCALCHVIQGKGGKGGPDLSDIGKKRDAADWLKRFLTAPKSVMPNAKMSAFKGNSDELDSLVEYMTSLK